MQATQRLIAESMRIATQMKRKEERIVMTMKAASRVLLSTKAKRTSGQLVGVGGRILRRGIF